MPQQRIPRGPIRLYDTLRKALGRRQRETAPRAAESDDQRGEHRPAVVSALIQFGR